MKSASVTAWPFELAVASAPHRTHFSPMTRLHCMQNRVIRLSTERDGLGKARSRVIYALPILRLVGGKGTVKTDRMLKQFKCEGYGSKL